MTGRRVRWVTLVLWSIAACGCAGSSGESPASDGGEEATPDAPTPTEDAPVTPDDTAEPTGDTAEPSGDTAEPIGDTAEPSGDTAEPSGDTAEPIGDTAEPSGDTAEPSGDGVTSSCTEEPTFFTCSGGEQVPECACSTLGWQCLADPKTQCPGSCYKEEAAEQPCPAAYPAQPWCACDGGAWKCDGEPGAGCWGQHCQLADGGADWTCPGGEQVPFCQCINEEPPCELECKSDPAEGWYDSCSGELVEKTACEGCTIACDKIGTKSEGWWADCGSGPAVIAWVFCGSGLWSCIDEPWTACPPLACKQEGESFNLSEKYDLCCPGLVPTEEALWDQSSGACGFADCDCRICTACGDGVCGTGENPCVCPADCEDPG